MVFREIDDELWEILRKHLPLQKPHIGRPRCDPRRLLNGILYVLTTGCTWSDVPAQYGTKSTVHRYHLELYERGVYQAILTIFSPAAISKSSTSLTASPMPIDFQPYLGA